MRVVLQRVKKASVAVGGEEIASIGRGFLLLVGVAKEDTREAAAAMAKKISKLRIFEDENDKMNLDIFQAGGEILSVPQFTLLADTAKGNRPGFDNAASPEKAKALWEELNKAMEQENTSVKRGDFGTHMEIDLVNDGPVTFVLDSKLGG